MKIGKALLSISLAFVLSGCAILKGGFGNKSSSSSSSGAHGTGWDWGGGGGKTSSSGPTSSSDYPSSSSSGPTIYSITIEAPKTILGIGESVTFSAIVDSSDNYYWSYDLKWSSSNSDVAMVEYGGRVTGKSIGTAVIRAESYYDSSVYDTVMVTVNQHEMVIVGVESFDLDTTYKLGTYYDEGYSFYYYYANGEITNQSGPCLAASGSFSSAVDLKVEGTTDHYHLALFIDEQKKYINTVSDVDYHISLDSTYVNDWSWDETYYTFTTIVNGVKYLMQRNGSYFYMSNYDNASFSNVARLLIQTEKADPESIDIVEDNVRLLVNSDFYLSVKISPIGASLTRLNWTVLDNENVSVSSQGRVRVSSNAKRGTTATIKASWNSSVSDTCTISIYSYGTLDDPLAVDEVCSLIDEESSINHRVYLSGIVTSNSAFSYSSWSEIVLANNDGSISSALYLTNIWANNGYGSIYAEANSLVGKRIVIETYGLHIENSKYCSNGVDLVSVSNN